MSADISKTINLRLLSLAVALLVMTLAGLSLYSRSIFEPRITPELTRKSENVASYLVAQVNRAVQWGIPLDRLAGTEDLFADIAAENKDISYILITDPAGAILHVRGALASTHHAALRKVSSEVTADGNVRHLPFGEEYLNTAMPISGQSGTVGLLHVGVRGDYVTRQLEEVYYDLGIILLVCVLFTFEILLYFINMAVVQPIRGIQDLAQRIRLGDFSQSLATRSSDEIGRIGRMINEALDGLRRDYERLALAATAMGGEARQHLDKLSERLTFTSDKVIEDQQGLQSTALIRIAIFVFSLAEELTRTFLSVYIKDLFDPIPGLSMEMVIGAPITLFMALWALAQPLAGSYSERFGRRKIFLYGALLSAIGLVGAGLAGNLVHLLVARCITAVGYAMVFISAQGFVIDNTTSENRAQGMAGYAGGILTAGVCGPAIGGILADQLGYRITFVLSAGLAIFAALMVYHLVQERVNRAPSAKLRLRDMGTFFTNPGFMGVVLFSAIPTKMALTGLVFFLIPLYLNDQGVSQSMIGRVLLLYWLTMIFVSPLASSLSDKLGNRKLFVALGGALAAAAGMLAVMNTSIWAVVAGVTVLGLAHGLVMTPQLALVTTVSRDVSLRLGETTVLAMFRLLERIGNVIAPFVAGLFLAHYGYAGAISGIGYVLAACAILCIMIFFLVRDQVQTQPTGAELK